MTLPFNLSVPLNLSAPTTSTSGALDTGNTSNESHTGNFVVGGSGHTLTETRAGGPTQTGGAAPGALSPSPGTFSPGGGADLLAANMVGNPIILGLICLSLYVLAKRGRI